MTYEVEFLPAARNSLRRLPQDLRARIIKRIETLAENPRQMAPGASKAGCGASIAYR